MTDDEIREALKTMKQRALNVGALTTTAERHVELVELIIDSEAILRGFNPIKRSRKEVEDAIEQEIRR